MISLTLQKTEKRDSLISVEKKYQRQWEENGVFHANAPPIQEVPLDAISANYLHEKYPKYFVTMAYP